MQALTMNGLLLPFAIPISVTNTNHLSWDSILFSPLHSHSSPLLLSLSLSLETIVQSEEGESWRVFPTSENNSRRLLVGYYFPNIN